MTYPFRKCGDKMEYNLNDYLGVDMYYNNELVEQIIQIASDNNLTPAQLKCIFWHVLNTIDHDIPIHK